MSLTATQRAGLLRLGDVIIPGDDELPSFTESGVVDEVDRMVDWMYESDRSAILMLLTVVARMPRPAIKALVLATERGDSVPEPLGGGLRMASLGIKGLVLSLYYSGVDRGGRVRQVIRYDADVPMHPEEPDRTLAENASLPPVGRQEPTR
jgi:hypothetical protein